MFTVWWPDRDWAPGHNNVLLWPPGLSWPWSQWSLSPESSHYWHLNCGMVRHRLSRPASPVTLHRSLSRLWVISFSSFTGKLDLRHNYVKHRDCTFSYLGQDIDIVRGRPRSLTIMYKIFHTISLENCYVQDQIKGMIKYKFELPTFMHFAK